MRLEKNMYVRTIGGIERLKKENDNGWFFEKSMIIKPDNIEKYIIKASHNIIDLIEENDFINGLRVEKNKYGELYTSYVYYGGGIGKQCEVYTTWLKEYTEDMIENIVTKEQFESIKYSLEG